MYEIVIEIVDYEVKLKWYKKVNVYTIRLLTTTIEEKPLHLTEIYTTAKKNVGKIKYKFWTNIRTKIRTSLPYIIRIHIRKSQMIQLLVIFQNYKRSG